MHGLALSVARSLSLRLSLPSQPRFVARPASAHPPLRSQGQQTCFPWTTGRWRLHLPTRRVERPIAVPALPLWQGKPLRATDASPDVDKRPPARGKAEAPPSCAVGGKGT